MEIELKKVELYEREILARLIELYEYDFSDFEQSDLNSNGLYGYEYLDSYWKNPQRFPYFILVNGKYAGFVLVCDYCYVSTEENTFFMSEFFVMKKYRNKGVGQFAASKIFSMHLGLWELTVHPNNPSSHLFWKKIIRRVGAEDFKIHDQVKNVYELCDAIAYTFRTPE